MSARVYRLLGANLGGRAPGPLPMASLLRQTPGGQLMVARRPQRFAQLFEAFRARLLTTWRWLPESAASHERGAVLDGAVNAGDAASLAAELVLLATAPAPFGLGLSPSACRVVPYRGEAQQGFVAEHSQAGVLGLRSDVLGRDGRPTDLRRWRCHSLVAADGRFYDPAYGHVYAQLGEAADYSLAPLAPGADGVHWRAARDRLRRTVWFQEEGARLRGPFSAPPAAVAPVG